MLSFALVASCVGEIGNPAGIGHGEVGGSGSPGGSSSASASAGSASGGGSAPVVPFEPFSVPAYVTKVKTMLTGLAPTQAEISAVTADAGALSGLVTAWMQLPQYSPKMEAFFADAFQQSQVQPIQLTNPTFDELLQNWQQGFAKTVTELIAEGRPFTETVTTTRYMMTTAMMTEYAYEDVAMSADATQAGMGAEECRYYDTDKTWGFKLTASPVSLADSGNPASPSYLVFNVPNLSAQYGYGSLGAQDAPAGSPPCGGYDPVVYDASTSFAQGDNLCNWLYSYLLGGNFWFQPPNQSSICYGASKFLDRPSHPRAFIPSDYTDWRMVTITQAKSVADETRFFDLVGNRASSTLSLFQQRVGYFTTPPFLAQYATNISNQARVTIDQTMIVGLGRAFDGSDPVTVANAPGLDPTHAANPACFECHWNLDPMARFFRSNFTTSYSQQQDPAQIAIPGTFLFDSVVGTSDTSLYYLADQIATHPEFKTAWTVKLCAWANSGTCLANDPEVQRVAQVFASSNYDWNTLVHELFTSPLVTNVSSTLTAQTVGTVVPIVRRAQICATLNARLGLTDVCGYDFIPNVFGGSGGTSRLPSPPFCDCADDPAVPPAPCASKCADPGPIPPAAGQLPVDGYSRGVAAPLYINGPDPFWRSSIEQICAYVADVVVDAGTAPLYSSATPAQVTTSIASMVGGLMGLDSSRSAVPLSILTSHYASARGGGSAATVALKSTFTAACLSPWVAAVGE